MDKLVNSKRSREGSGAPSGLVRPSREEAEAAVRILIRWAGDDPEREGLLATPARVVRAYEEWFAGYNDNPRDYLKRTFEETGGYDEVVVLRDIRFESHCEHHLAPIIGRVHIGYLPRNRVVGISKLARLVEVYARRLQIQEKMTAEIASCLDAVLKPHGVAVVTEATHQCMTTATPCGLSTASRQEAISAVIFSWICKRRAKTSTSRASLEMPTTRLRGK